MKLNSKIKDQDLMSSPTCGKPNVGSSTVEKSILSDSFIDMVYCKYEIKSGGFPQGFCGQIAEELHKVYGGEIVAGYLNYGTGLRQHWWVETDTNIIDPMFEVFNSHTKCRHVKVHNNLQNKYW